MAELLIVEDKGAPVMAARFLLEAFGHRVTHKATLESAIAHIDEVALIDPNFYTAIAVDANLTEDDQSGKDGPTVYKHIVERKIGSFLIDYSTNGELIELLGNDYNPEYPLHTGVTHKSADDLLDAINLAEAA